MPVRYHGPAERRPSLQAKGAPRNSGASDGLPRPDLPGPGVAAATWMGAKLAGVICGDADDNPFSKISFHGAPIGLRSGNTWALPLAGAYYRVRDWLT